jgi:hypothetical protein
VEGKKGNTNKRKKERDTGTNLRNPRKRRKRLQRGNL